MRKINIKEYPEMIYGLDKSSLPQYIHRLPQYMKNKINEKLWKLSNASAGVRVRFRTNSENVIIKIQLKENKLDKNMSLAAAAGADVYLYDEKIRYMGIASPQGYDTTSAQLSVTKPQKLQEIIVQLPRNEEVTEIEIELDDTSVICEALPYKYTKPVVFYGSSITMGGCASRPSLAYTQILSARLNFDYINLGFGGAAKGEKEMAEYIASLEMSVFVYDYDHNAPDDEHLKATHEPFFRIIRERNPQLPIIIMSRPDFDKNPPYSRRRRDIIKRTYENAVLKGDRNVYFIDGECFFGVKERYMCTIDGTHPNDIGFMRMADTVEPVLKKLLLKKCRR